MVPELSVNSWRSGLGLHCGSSMKLVPFHGVAKVFHHWISFRTLSGRVRCWFGEETKVLASIILRRKVMPAGTTLAAKLRVPMNERSSRLVQECLVSQASRARCRSSSLSCGKRASSVLESRMMPRNSRTGLGSSSFSSARGLHYCCVAHSLTLGSTLPSNWDIFHGIRSKSGHGP